MMNGKEKIYFLIDALDDTRTITPAGQPLIIDPTNDLNRNYRDIELAQLFIKLANDEKILKVLKAPSRTKEIDIIEDLDPYDHADDGCWHIELLPSFDSYFSKIKLEPEYQDFTGYKPASQIKPTSNNLMTYEKKLDLVVKAVLEASKTVRKGVFTVTLYLNATNGLDRLPREEIHNILLQLQDDKSLKVHPLNNRLLPPNQQPTHYFLLDIPEFADWYEGYLMQQKTGLEKIDYINMLRIYDVVLDVNEQVQLTNKTTVTIHLLPHLVRFSVLFPTDSIGFRDKYCETRWDSLKYLKQKGVIDDFKHNEALHRWQTTVTVSFKLSKFDNFYRTIQEEYIKRNKANNEDEKSQTAPIKIDREASEETVWPDDFRWEGRDFVLGQYGKINFTSDDRRHIFKILTDKKGGWATISELKGNKDAGYVRSTIKQIEDRLPEKAKGHIKITSTQDDSSKERPNTGAYRIKVQE